ncbi:MAG: hypothetical protein A2Y38_25570 [Spirochaetes bacterium GWB1_59_5]|nr:MAG: hypothetical protein A2Y38_25570 [Spirochaetes bacterium GWB1_59_5]
MSQDLRRERDGVAYETIAGATQYIAELEAENKRLKAQVHSLASEVSVGSIVPPGARPDDREINKCIDEAESLNEALFEIADKYGADVTNNEERWQGGVFLREIGDFIDDVREVAERFVGRQGWDRGYLAGRSDAYADVYDSVNPYV